MSAAAPHLVEHAHEVVERLSAAIQSGGSAAHLQLICSELFESLQAAIAETTTSDTVRRNLLVTALDQCKRSADPALSASLRLAQLRATVALLQSGLPEAPGIGLAGERPRFHVIQGGLA